MDAYIIFILTNIISAIGGIFYLGQVSKKFTMQLEQLDLRLQKVESLAPMANDVIILKSRVDRHELALEKAIDGLRDDIKELNNILNQFLRDKR